MKVNYTIRKMTLKDSSKAHVEKKLAKLDKFFTEQADVQVTFSLEKNRVKVEITIRDRALVYRAEDEQVDALDAFDKVFDMLVRQIRKEKTRLEKRLRVALPEGIANEEEPVEDDTFEIVRSKKFYMRPMDAEEAILEMNLIGHQFFVFRNADTNEINVVYRRKDGAYGLIEPELD